jgi:F-type H+-transporting ATPase subunit a
MALTPDDVVLWRHGWLVVNQTIATTWGIMGLLTLGSWGLTRSFTRRESPSLWWQSLEIVVIAMRDQIREVGLRPAERFMPFLGTLFLFLASAALLTIVPGYVSPSSSLSTTTALALAVFLAVPLLGSQAGGFRRYLGHFVEPVPLLLPFHILSEVTRTVALAVRLFGNALSESMVVGIMLTIAPFFFPVLVSLLGLVIGFVQAYIFAMLATVYVAAAGRVTEGGP